MDPNIEIPRIIDQKFLKKTVSLYSVNPEAEVDLARSVFCFNSVDRIDLDTSFTVSRFLLNLMPALGAHSPFSLLDPLPCLLNSPLYDETGVFLKALNAVNTARIAKDKYLLWATLVAGNTRSTVGLVFVDIATNSACVGCTNDGHIYSTIQILHRVFSLTHISAKMRTREARDAFLLGLCIADKFAHITDVHPLHFGHYIHNSLGHLLRLEELGLTSYFSVIYRSSRLDFFDDETLLLGRATRRKTRVLEISESNPSGGVLPQQLIPTALSEGYAVICSKDTIISGSLWRAVRKVLPKACNEKIDPSFSVCIGIRGGSREALNLDAILCILVNAIHSRTGCNVHLILDGMSESNSNSLNSTAALSEVKEQEIVQAIREAFKSDPRVRITSVVGLPLIQQLECIRQCRLAFGHQGSSTFKYMYLLGLDIIVHGHNSGTGLLFAKDCHDETWKPRELNLGPKYVESRFVDPGASPFYANYTLNEELCRQFFAGFDFARYLVNS